MYKRILPSIVLAGLALAANANWSDTFSYADGPLTTGSGGLWQYWDGVGPSDATVSSGVAIIEGPTDVIREGPGILQNVGDTGSISWQYGTNVDHSTEAYAFYMSPATFPYTTGQNYAQSLGVLLDWSAANAPAGQVSVVTDEGGAAFYVANIGTGMFDFRADYTHSAGSMAFNLFINNTLVRSSSFAFTDPRGLNAIEFYQFQTNSTAAFGMVDNINVVPEPATVGGILVGLVALAARRSRK